MSVILDVVVRYMVSRGGGLTFIHSFCTVRAKVHEPAIGIDFESKFLQRFSKDRSAWFFDATAIHCVMGGRVA